VKHKLILSVWIFYVSRQTGDTSLAFAVGIDSSCNKLFLTIAVPLKRVSALLIINIIFFMKHI
jgi:hypothetical protein